MSRPSRRLKPGPTHGIVCLPGRPAAPADAPFTRLRSILMPVSSSASNAPKAGDAAFDEYVSDPAKPVPFRARPIQPMGYTEELSWSRWLVDDQREASGRPDVAGVHFRCADCADEDQRPADCKSCGLHQRHRLRLGGEVDRCLSRRGGGRPEDGWISANDLC